MIPTASGERCFAIRRVNPYLGLLQVVEGRDARAYSLDGRVWQVQVLGDRPDHTWRSHGDLPPSRQFFAFGLWDAEGGLQRIPANPLLDIGAMREVADTLTKRLGDVARRLPFDLADAFECWATDAAGHPLALLASSDDAAVADTMHIRPWQATAPADMGFVSATLAHAGVAASDADSQRRHAAYLEALVTRHSAGRTWFRRRDDGSGVAVADPAIQLDATRFPSFGLAADWPDETDRATVRDYFAWQAPHLLLLQRISDADRAWLERQALQQAVALADNYALLPRIIDHAGIEAARVEARLRRTRN